MIPDQWPTVEVLDQQSAWDAARGLRWRVRVVVGDFKYPTLRLEEALRPDPSGGEERLIAQEAMVADHVLATARAEVGEADLSQLLRASGVTVRRRQPGSDVYLLEIPRGRSVAGLPTALTALSSRDAPLSVVEPDYLVRRLLRPNDMSPFAFWLDNRGNPSVGGVADADIDAPEAWAINTGSRAIRVGVLDTGIDSSNPDLAANLWVNLGEIPGNGVDDDGNGYVDDVLGWNFVSGNADTGDDDGHGTVVASLLGAEGDNGIGGVGVAWQVSMAALKILNAEGIGATSDAIEAIRYATRQGFELTNNSWGGYGASQTLQTAISEANTAGRLFVAAAGNDGLNTDVVANRTYPANFALPNILAVAATDRDDALAPFSNRGRGTVHLAAPGKDVWNWESGTSFAAPQVTGAAVLVLSHLGPLNASQLKAILLESVDPVPALAQTTISGGRLSVATALRGRNRSVHQFVFDPIPGPLVRGAPVRVRMRAVTSTGLLVGTFNSPVAITAQGTTLAAPVSATDWVGGVWSGWVTPASDSASATFRVTHGGRNGVSNAFAVSAGPIAAFTWSGVPTFIPVDQPFPVVVQGVDAGGAVRTDYTGPLALNVVRSFLHPSREGSDYDRMGYPFASGAVARLQVYYPDAEVGGGARRLDALALQASLYNSPPFLQNFTVRLKNTRRREASSSFFENQGWTTVYRRDLTISEDGLLRFPFDTPFDYTAEGGLLVDFSFRNPNHRFDFAFVASYTSDRLRSLGRSSEDPSLDPATFDVAPNYEVNQAPRIRFSDQVSVPLHPAAVTLTNGRWSGEVSVPIVENTVRLEAERADRPEVAGRSAPFDALPSAVLPREGFPFRETWASGTFSSRWQLSGSGRAGITLYDSIVTLQHAGYGVSRGELTLSLDLLGHRGVRLSFRARNEDYPDGIDYQTFEGGADFDGVAISVDGRIWHEIQPLRSPWLGWQAFDLDLDAALAARNLTFTSDTRIRFNRYGGTNDWGGRIQLGEISVVAEPHHLVRVQAPERLVESGASATGTVRLPYTLATTAVLQLTSSAPAKLRVPANVTIPAGQLEASFALTPLNDEIFDGDRAVVVRVTPPSGSSLSPGTATVVVADDESATATLTLSHSTIHEGRHEGGIGRLTLSRAPSSPIVFQLETNPLDEVSLPPSLTVAPGAVTAEFTYRPVNNDRIDGTRAVVVTARSPQGHLASAALGIEDDEHRRLENRRYDHDPRLFEGSVAVIRFYLGGKISAPLTIIPSASPPGLVELPPFVVIPAGASEVVFELRVLDDDLRTGNRPLTLRGSAPGFEPVEQVYSLVDNDPARYTVFRDLAPPIANRPFDLMVRAFSLEGFFIQVPRELILRAYDEVGPVEIHPTRLMIGNFNAVTRVTVHRPGTGIRLVVSDEAGITAELEPFDVGVGPFHRLVLGAVAPSPIVGHPALWSIAATDQFGNHLPDANGPASLQQILSHRLASDEDRFPGLGLGFENSRSQLIYLRDEIPDRGAILGISLRFSGSAAAASATSIRIRAKPTPLSHYTNETEWEPNIGWTLVHEGIVAPSVNGWAYFPFILPLPDDGTGNLLLDFITSQPSPNHYLPVNTMATTAPRLLIRTERYGYRSDPRLWRRGDNWPDIRNEVFNLRMHRAGQVLVSAQPPLVLSAGGWSGSLVFDRESVTPVDFAAHFGMIGQLLPPFPILGQLGTPIFAPEPRVTGGLANTLEWSLADGADAHEIEAARNPVFTAPEHRATTSGTSHTFTPLAESPWHYRVRGLRTRPPGDPAPPLAGPWSAPVTSIQDATPPSLTIQSAATSATPAYLLTGTATDANGLSWLKVNGAESAASAQWSRALTLAPGENALSVAVADQATPPNIATLTHVVLQAPAEPTPFTLPAPWLAQHGLGGVANQARAGLLDDPDGDALPNLLEYALGQHPLEPARGNPVQLTRAAHPSTGAPHLQLGFTRRLVPGELRYHIEVSENLIEWSTPTAPPELVSRLEDSLAGTEHVSYRLHPALGLRPLFARLRVGIGDGNGE